MQTTQLTPTVVVTIEQAIEKWTNHLTARRQSKEEITRKARDVRRLAELMDAQRPSDITPAKINDALDTMVVSSKTIINRVDRLRAFCDYCIEHGWLTTNPAETVRKPKHIAGEGVRALTSDEVKRLLVACDECRDGRNKRSRAPFYIIAAMTGLRRLECQKLRWKHVNLRAEKPYLALDGEVTKNSKACDLPIMGPAIGAFASIMPPHPDPEAPVFETIPAHHTFNKDLKRAGIPKHDERGRPAAIHSLRKHLATALIEGGADIYTTKTMMRHSTIATTEQSYIDSRVSRVSEAASSALSGGGPNRKSGFFSESELERLTHGVRSTDTEPGGPIAGDQSSGVENGAGGNRTPVPKRPERRIYACSQRFNLNPPPATDSLLRVQSPVINLAASPPGTPRVGQPAVIEPRHSRRLAGFRLPVYQAAMRYCSSADIIVAWFLRGHHAPRRATPNLKLARSKPHRPQSVKQVAT